jgi:hypothetical protein
MCTDLNYVDLATVPIVTATNYVSVYTGKNTE